MTTKPKAKKFRIRRSAAPGGTSGSANSVSAAKRPVAAQTAQPVATQPAANVAETQHSTQAQPQAKPQPKPTPQSAPEAAPARTLKGQVDSAQAIESENTIDAIKREGLTGRQLRMARRVAQKHNLPATSDYDAVRLLRQKGIDPFKRSNMLELVVPKSDANAVTEDGGGEAKVQLPQTLQPAKQTLPSTELSPAQRRDLEISQMQRDISLRRRKKMLLLLTRLSFFVLLPTLIVGFYFYRVATPMYASKSEFLILQADNAGGGIGGLLSGTQFATSQDSIAVQSFLESKEAMLRLDRDDGFKSHFSQEWIDPIQRLSVGASNEEAYKIYSRIVSIGYDPTEGVIRMEVSAADPQVAAQFSTSLISYAEQRVNDLSETKREDQMRDARVSFETAQEERRNAQEALVTLQQKGSILDPEGVIAGKRSRITALEVQIQEKELELAALQDNPRPNRAKVDGAKGDIQRYKELLTRLNAEMIDASNGENSLAQLAVRIQLSQADLASRDMMLQSALQQMETTRMEANRQVRYLTTSVQPVASEEASYPRKFENTILAFLLFSGVYLMISLTASILREQVSS
jgi:capsular polysaccharide transport system permease protein